MFTFVPRPPSSSPLSAIQGTYVFGDGNPSTVTTITYSFGEYLDTGDWTPALKAQFRMALSAIEAVANINFVEISNNGTADLIEVVAPSSFFSSPTTLGFHQVPGPGGGTPLFGAFNTDYWNAANGSPGGYFFTTILHEIGHALGLGHPHDTGLGTTVMAGVTNPFNSFGVSNLNQGIYTVMSYNDGWTSQNGILPVSATYGGSTGLGALDIAALQAMYGANTSTNSGNNTYTLASFNAAGTGYQAIWDTGGIDTLSHTGANSAFLDLRPATLDYTATGGGAVSFASGVQGGFTIAYGVVIENASGGSGDDTIIGNTTVNGLSGNGGNDTFYSVSNGSNNNVINGGSGNDTIHVAAGTGADIVDGGADNDIAIVSSNAGSFTGGTGIDTIRFISATTGYLFLDNGTTFGFLNVITRVVFTVSNDVELFEFSNGLQAFTQAGVMQAMQVSDVETNGTVLQHAAQGIYVLDGGTDNIALTFNGQVMGQNSLAGWNAVQAEETASGYRVLWQNVDGSYSEWLLNSQGQFVSSAIVGNVVDLEAVYGADVNGDGTIGHTTTTVENAGSITLQNSTQNGYIIDGNKTLSLNGQSIGANTLPGWTAVQVEAFGGGYKVLLKNINGTYAEWELNSAGEYVAGTLIDSVVDVETFYGADIDGDGNVGHVLSNIDTNGAVNLAVSTQDAYVVDGTKTLTLNGQKIGPNSIPGWQAIQAEAYSGGYKVLLRSSDGTYAEWTLDSTGAYVSGAIAGNVYDLETFYSADLNGDSTVGHVTTTVENAGSVTLQNSTQTGYIIDSSKPLTLNGQNIGPNTLPGWTAVQVEAFGAGYKVLLKNTDGTYAEWELDNAGEYVTGVLIDNVVDVETFYGADINGDSATGHTTTTVENDGAVTLQLSTQTGYIVDGDKALSLNGQPVTPDTLPGWSAIHAEAFGSGYKVLLKNADGTFAEWTLNSAGHYESGSIISNIVDFETFYDADLNGDGTVGHTTTVIENNGSTTLSVSTQTGYIIDGDKSLTLNGQAVGPNTLPGWQAIHTEAFGSGYKVLLKHTDGTYAEWTLDGNGGYLSGEIIPEVIDVEDFYQYDINGSGTVGYALPKIALQQKVAPLLTGFGEADEIHFADILNDAPVQTDQEMAWISSQSTDSLDTTLAPIVTVDIADLGLVDGLLNDDVFLI